MDMKDLQATHDTVQIRPADLSHQYHPDSRSQPHVFFDVNLNTFICDCSESLFGILAQPEDIPALIERYPTDQLDEPHPVILSHTNAFPSKYDLRSIDNGVVTTQLNFGSVPGDARILDLRPRSFDGGIFRQR
jgi:hypothetical protein